MKESKSKQGKSDRLLFIFSTADDIQIEERMVQLTD